MASANGVGVESSRKELLDAQAHVYNHTFNFINSMSLNCAIQLGIPDIIHKHGKPMTLSQLADAIPINKAKSHGLFRIMRILVHSKFFNKVRTNKDKVEDEDVDEEEAYCLTQASCLLLRDNPISLAPYVISMIDPIMMDPFHHLSEWLRKLYIFKWILHDWSDEDCVKILEKCKEAITPNGGKVIIVEMILEDQIEDEKATQTQFFFDILMMIGLTGKQRSEKEWSQLFSAAGFRHYKMTPVALGLRSVIEVFP